jgi:hypothetical protein
VGVEPNHTTARKPGPLQIIQYSLHFVSGRRRGGGGGGGGGVGSRFIGLSGPADSTPDGKGEAEGTRL